MTARLEPFHAIAVSRIAHRLGTEGRSIIHMEFGQPSTGAPAEAIAAAHHVLDTDPMGYWESPKLKARIARHYGETCGAVIDPEQIVLTCGASPGLVLALSLLFDPGARVAIARPGYVAYRNNLRALHMEPVELRCGEAERYQVTAAALDALDPVPDGLILASPANPTGTVIEPAELAAIAEVCRRKGIRVISDEIYHGITYGAPAVSMLAEDRQAIVVNSFSKYFSMAGWRLGWVVVPAALVDQARARMGNLFLTPPVLAQHAGLIAFDCRDELEGHVATYARKPRSVAGGATGHGAGPHRPARWRVLHLCRHRPPDRRQPGLLHPPAGGNRRRHRAGHRFRSGGGAPLHPHQLRGIDRSRDRRDRADAALVRGAHGGSARRLGLRGQVSHPQPLPQAGGEKKG